MREVLKINKCYFFNITILSLIITNLVNLYLTGVKITNSKTYWKKEPIVVKHQTMLRTIDLTFVLIQIILGLFGLNLTLFYGISDYFDFA